MKDIVFPNGNEQDFIRIAQQLGITKLVFAYPDKKQFYNKPSKIPITNALHTTPNKLQRGKTQYTICQGSREAIERGATLVYGFEEQSRKEHTHYRRSGLNQVLCKIATQKNVSIAFPFAAILNKRNEHQAQHLGRIAQNIAFCQKYNTPMKIASFATTPYEMRPPKDLAAFFTLLGMQPTTIKKALN